MCTYVYFLYVSVEPRGARRALRPCSANSQRCLCSQEDMLVFLYANMFMAPRWQQGRIATKSQMALKIIKTYQITKITNITKCELCNLYKI